MAVSWTTALAGDTLNLRSVRRRRPRVPTRAPGASSVTVPLRSGDRECPFTGMHPVSALGARPTMAESRRTAPGHAEQESGCGPSRTSLRLILLRRSGRPVPDHPCVRVGPAAVSANLGAQSELNPAERMRRDETDHGRDVLGGPFRRNAARSACCCGRGCCRLRAECRKAARSLGRAEHHGHRAGWSRRRVETCRRPHGSQCRERARRAADPRSRAGDRIGIARNRDQPRHCRYGNGLGYPITDRAADFSYKRGRAGQARPPPPVIARPAARPRAS